MIEACTLVINLLVMAVSIWLGIYIVTRNPRSIVSWMASITIWALASYHLYNALEIHPPQTNIWVWLRPISYMGLPVWVNASFLLRREVSKLEQLPKAKELIIIPVIYILSLIVAIGGFSANPRSETGALYPAVLVLLILSSFLLGNNMLKCIQYAGNTTIQGIYTSLFVFTIVIATGGLLRGLFILFLPQIPTLWSDLIMGVGVIVFGFTVARHDAFIFGKTIERDFFYSLSGIGIAVCFFVGTMIPFYFSGAILIMPLIIIIICVVVSHSLFDGGRTILDRLFYRDQFHKLRDNLRLLTYELGSGDQTTEHFQNITYTLCNTFGIRECIIALLSENEEYIVKAGQGNYSHGQAFPASELYTTEIKEFHQNDEVSFENIALLVPLKAGGRQVGVLLLGQKMSGRTYSDADLEKLDDIADHLASFIFTSTLQEQNIKSINNLIVEFREKEREMEVLSQQISAKQTSISEDVSDESNSKELSSMVEECLRHLDDNSYLGNHKLAQIELVNNYLHSTQLTLHITHIERGKALSQVLRAALNKLRPDGKAPEKKHTISSTEYQYVVLHESYVQKELTRNIWIKLGISESTFHRIRRRAIDALARILEEESRL